MIHNLIKYIIPSHFHEINRSNISLLEIVSLISFFMYLVVKGIERENMELEGYKLICICGEGSYGIVMKAVEVIIYVYIKNSTYYSYCKINVYIEREGD